MAINLNEFSHPDELIHVEKLAQFSSPYMAHKILQTVQYDGYTEAVHAFKFGSDKPDVPVLFFTGGVHGLERIGAQVVLAFLDHLIQRLQWDEGIIHSLENIRIWFVPVVNPLGLKMHLRSNANHVDLMRNAPIDAAGWVTPFIGGHRISKILPWHRGDKNHMEPEAQALTDLVIKESIKAPATLLLDVHSGFGTRDRLWFPMASSRDPIHHLPDVHALYKLLINTYPHNDYIFEPQSQHYLTHGDLWDYSYLEALKSGGQLIPLTLEMGSWRWLKKNPLQLSRLGIFNPVKPHRVQRVLRHHLNLMEFLMRATRSWQHWMLDDASREHHSLAAKKQWYSNG